MFLEANSGLENWKQFRVTGYEIYRHGKSTGENTLKKSDFWMILIITVILIWMNYVVIAGGKPVEVSKAISTLEIKRFDPNNPPDDVSQTFHGVTKWQFECPCRVSYKTLEKVDDSGGSFVRVKITNVKANLALPIVMWMPDNPPRGLKAHEDGHVLICQRVYEDADNTARAIAGNLIGNEYSGNGRNLDDACKFASGIAAVTFSNEFEEKVAGKAQKISEIYDYLAQFRKYEQDRLVDEAFKLYERGKPRLVKESKIIGWSN